MTIGIDIRVLGNKIKSGIEEYTENLVPHLIKNNPDINFKLFYSSSKNQLPDYEWIRSPNVKLYKFKYPNNLLFSLSVIFHRPFLDKLVEGADIFFFPHFFLSALSPSCKRVTTFHDLSYLHFPEFLTLRKRLWHNFQMQPEWQARFSNKIIAMSESTKNDLVNFYKIDPTRIEVIYSGISKNFKNNKSYLFHDREINKIELEKFKKSKNLPDRFIFFLGKIEPRKNILNIIKAFDKVKENSKYSNLGLVISGSRGWLYEDILKETDLSSYKNQIIFTNQIKDEEKKIYYSLADIFVYPSFFEGFGFPPIESMFYGTPVVASRNSSLPEVLEDAAILIDPFNVQELKLWITHLLDNKNLYDLLSNKSINQAVKFNWEVTTSKTLEAILDA